MNELLSEVRELILSARKAVVNSVDVIQILTNFEIGRRIVEHEQEGAERAEYGEAVLIDLATALTDEFGRGFSLTNLKMMRKFYLTYRAKIGQTVSGFLSPGEKGQTTSDLLWKSAMVSRASLAANILQTTSAQFTLSWSHYVFLMGIRNASERSFYEIGKLSSTSTWARCRCTSTISTVS